MKNKNDMTILAYTLLALSICAVWLPPLRITGQRSLPPWLLLGILATAFGLAAGVLRPLGLIGLAVFALLAWFALREKTPCWQQFAFGFLTVVMALALAMHRLPGFNNPVLLAGVKLSPNSAPFTLYANFDKGAVGLVLLALFCRRTSSWAEFVAVIRKVAPIMMVTMVAVLGLAWLTHFVRFDFKLPESTLAFMSVNLFFTVIAEEAFFRGFIQDRLSLALNSTPWKNAIAVVVSALLFGVAHLAGGAQYAGLAALAGFGYAFAFQRTRRIESAIAAHFLLNASHFMTLTYPYLQ